jgi:hypothetical protein
VVNLVRIKQDQEQCSALVLRRTAHSLFSAVNRCALITAFAFLVPIAIRTQTAQAGRAEDLRSALDRQANLQRGCKSMLSLLFVLEKEYEAQHSKFTSDLSALKFEQSIEGKVFYKIGFASGDGVSNSEAFPKSKKPEWKSLQPKETFAALAKTYCPDCKVAGSKFKALLVGQIDDDADYDVWTIDDQKQLVQLKDDLNKLDKLKSKIAN